MVSRVSHKCCDDPPLRLGVGDESPIDKSKPPGVGPLLSLISGRALRLCLKARMVRNGMFLLQRTNLYLLGAMAREKCEKKKGLLMMC